VALVRSSERDDSRGKLDMDMKTILGQNNTHTKEMILCCIEKIVSMVFCSNVVVIYRGGLRTSIIV
jgi:hypothetical protein